MTGSDADGQVEMPAEGYAGGRENKALSMPRSIQDFQQRRADLSAYSVKYWREISPRSELWNGEEDGPHNRLKRPMMSGLTAAPRTLVGEAIGEAYPGNLTGPTRLLMHFH
ncbi:hypothetical protein HOY82DRAFT_611019 [Tuber indicum]|nr:hypothetical protein HOY82DRAFT_611019 [Tuber indicum]